MLTPLHEQPTQNNFLRVITKPFLKDDSKPINDLIQLLAMKVVVVTDKASVGGSILGFELNNQEQVLSMSFVHKTEVLCVNLYTVGAYERKGVNIDIEPYMWDVNKLILCS